MLSEPLHRAGSAGAQLCASAWAATEAGIGGAALHSFTEGLVSREVSMTRPILLFVSDDLRRLVCKDPKART